MNAPTDAYRRAREEALRELRATPLAVIERGAGARVDRSADRIDVHVRLLDRDVSVSYPEGHVRAEDGGSLRFGEELLTLHYLTRAAGELPLDDAVRYPGLPGASAYELAFVGRSEQPLARAFEERPEAVISAIGRIGGEPDREDQREGIWRIRFLPYLVLGVRLDRAGEGLPASATLLFPRRAGYLHHVEDLAVAGEILAERLLSIAGCSPEGHPLY